MSYKNDELVDINDSQKLTSSLLSMDDSVCSIAYLGELIPINDPIHKLLNLVSLDVLTKFEALKREILFVTSKKEPEHSLVIVDSEKDISG